MQPWAQGWAVKLPGLPEGSWDDVRPPSADCLHHMAGLETGWKIRLEAQRRAKLDFVPHSAGKAGVAFCPPTSVCVCMCVCVCMRTCMRVCCMYMHPCLEARVIILNCPPSRFLRQGH